MIVYLSNHLNISVNYNRAIIKLLPLLAKHLVYLSTDGQEYVREHRMYEEHRRNMHNKGLFLASGRKGSDWLAAVSSIHPCQTCTFGSCIYNQAVSCKVFLRSEI